MKSSYLLSLLSKKILIKIIKAEYNKINELYRVIDYDSVSIKRLCDEKQRLKEYINEMNIPDNEINEIADILIENDKK